MKHFFFGVAFLVCVNAIAQQAPGAVFDLSKEKWVAQVPTAAKLPSNAAMAELILAQSAAIQALSSQGDTLEARVAKLEKRGH